jgi:hypothetical protein
MAELRIPQYKEKKAIAVASKLLELSANQCDKYWLNKLMYYLERESLIKLGQPLFFDKLYSLPYGPIVSAVNDSIDFVAYPIDSSWSKYFSLDGNTVKLLKSADYSVLNNVEIKLIESAFHKFKGWDFDKLFKYFHNLPENKETQSREDISYEIILKKGGRFDNETIHETLDEISYLGDIEGTINCVS